LARIVCSYQSGKKPICGISECSIPVARRVSCGDDFKKGKPDPALVRLAIEKLDLPHPRCVMVGDTPYDCEAAGAAGAAAIGLLSGGFDRPALLAAGAIEVRGRIGELKAFLAENWTGGQ
jgi:phosphoglycolate phosphatase-like HAD superfamily hydrolase